MPIPCLVCGGEVKLAEYLERMCSLCNKKEKNELVCCKGHYVCYECHSGWTLKDTPFVSPLPKIPKAK